MNEIKGQPGFYILFLFSANDIRLQVKTMFEYLVL